MWQWSRSTSSEGQYADIDGADIATYTPTVDDHGMYIRVIVTYGDGFDADNTATATTSNAVDVNFAPEFSDGETVDRTVDEDTAAAQNIGDPIAATDTNDDDTLTYSLGGTDAASFAIDAGTGQLMTEATLDFETQDSYSVTVEVRDSRNDMGAVDTAVDDTIAVTINVINVEEDGAVTLTTAGAEMAAAIEGAEITASVEDGDGSITNIVWQWSSSASAEGQYADIDGATDATYTPAMEDKGMYIRAMVTYDDGFDTGNTATATTSNAVAVNTAPVYADASTERSVEENTAAGESIGAAVTATDADTGDTLTYTLGGTDMASFTIDASTGQLMTSATLDFETETTYEVEVTATDGSGATAMIMVTIMVTDVSLGALGDTYDLGNDEQIDRDDLVAAVRAFRATTIDRDELVALVRLFQRTLGS